MKLNELPKSEQNLIKIFRKIESDVVEIQIRDSLPAVAYPNVSLLMERSKIQDPGPELTEAEDILIRAIAEVKFGTITVAVDFGQPRILPELSRIRIDLSKIDYA